MAYTAIIYTQKDHIASITLNRPETDNIINQRLAQELEDICYGINQDDNIYVVVITGAGDGAFCGGSELERLIQAVDVRPNDLAPKLGVDPKKLRKYLREQNPTHKKNDPWHLAKEQILDAYRRFRGSFKHNVAAAVASIDRPVIAAINGDALGWGLELALSCDVRLASHKARFGFPQVASGLMPMDGGTQRLPRIVGRGKALELILTAESISAEEALAIGLVSQVVPRENLAAEVEALAQNIASKAPIALRYIKEAVNKGLDLTLEQGLRLEGDLYFLLHTTADRTEGIKAFLEKRPPDFKGK